VVAVHHGWIGYHLAAAAEPPAQTTICCSEADPAADAVVLFDKVHFDCMSTLVVQCRAGVSVPTFQVKIFLETASSALISSFQEVLYQGGQAADSVLMMISHPIRN
jgi:hypothetical protein